MNCERYQRLLHLNRSGEISSHEAEELRRHLRLCEKCSLELQRIERADGFIDHLGAFSPTPRNPEKITADILRRVRAGSTSPKSLSPLDRVLDFFVRPSVRYLTVAIISLAVLTPATQLVMMLNDISNLEQRMASPVRRDAAEATYTMQSKTLQEVATSKQGESIKENISLTVTNDRIDVSAKEVDALLADPGFRNLSTAVGASVLGIDKKRLEKIVNEIKATAERSFRLDGKGA
jgi:hypothetical protein